MKIEAENKYEDFVLNHFKKILVGGFLVAVLAMNASAIPNIVPNYPATWTCEYNQSTLAAHGSADPYKQITGGYWLEGPVELEYKNYSAEYNVRSWRPNPNDCKPLAERLQNNQFS